MPIFINGQDGPLLADSLSYVRESELEEVVASCPQLLQGIGDSTLALVARQVTIPEAGILDLLLVSEEGLPVAVEVKLGRNGESRREIIAQIIDYLSALANLTNDELDRALAGAVERALRSFDCDPDVDEFERRWQELGVNLRGGSARVILVLDESRPELERIVRFLKDRSSLDVRLVVIAKHHHDSVGTMFSSQMVIGTREEQAARPRTVVAQGALRPGVARVVAAYDDMAPIELRTYGGGTSYRKIRPPYCPRGLTVHYEFYQAYGSIGVELHLENRRAAALLGPLLQEFKGRTIGPNNTPLDWDPRWSGGCGRLRALLPVEDDPNIAAQAMGDLIDLTRQAVAQSEMIPIPL